MTAFQSLSRTTFIGFFASFILLSASTVQSDADIEISPLQKVDNVYLNHKREAAADLSFKNISKIVRGDKRDLATIQALLDLDIVGPADEQDLFSLGVLLGDVYVKEHQLEWRNYLDNRGKSRAVCIPKTTNCLFPITMISKRVTRGFKVDVNELYANGLDLIEDFFPKLPYSAK